MILFSLVLVLKFTVLLTQGFSDPDPIPSASDNSNDPGLPLILTSYIENNKLEEARKLSRVKFPEFPDLRSYAGFFTVDKTYNSNQFLWYFPAKSYIKEQVVILWLQGGPGASSLFGLFKENGPLEVRNGTFHDRHIHWAKDHNLIYIDSPVGTGFSFTNDSRGYCINQTQIGDHLFTTLEQFLKLFPELQNFPFFISGESYGGKYVPALAYTIHKKNPTGKIKINLKGLIIGNGWSDPVNQLDYSDYLYQIGLIDWNQQKELQARQKKVIELIKTEAWLDATNATLELYENICDYTGNISLTSYLPSKSNFDDEELLLLQNLIVSLSVRKAIHVGNVTYHNQTKVFEIMLPDVMKSVAPWISELLESYHILFYNGQLDINVAYPLTVNFLKKLNFSAKEEYLKAKRKVMWNVAHNKFIEVAGFVKNAGKLTEVMIRNAGHMAPADQPELIFNLIVWWRLYVVQEQPLQGNEVILNATEYIERDNNNFINEI